VRRPTCRGGFLFDGVVDAAAGLLVIIILATNECGSRPHAGVRLSILEVVD
jgi:hypothetical protein